MDQTGTRHVADNLGQTTFEFMDERHAIIQVALPMLGHISDYLEPGSITTGEMQRRVNETRLHQDKARSRQIHPQEVTVRSWCQELQGRDDYRFLVQLKRRCPAETNTRRTPLASLPISGSISHNHC